MSERPVEPVKIVAMTRDRIKEKYDIDEALESNKNFCCCVPDYVRVVCHVLRQL